jgi:DNA-binding NtrC family response regulator
MIKDGTFLEDLYYRLDINLRIPSLSERREDIPDLVKYFLENEKRVSTAPVWFCKRHVQFITDALVAKNYHWPGNIRQLKSVLGEIYELCVRDCLEAEFEAAVSKVIAVRCTDGQRHGYSEVVRGLSLLVHNHVAGYKDSDRSLRAVIDEVLIEGIGTGLDMAIVSRKYIPQNPKHIGRTLGIKSLMNGSRYNLPRDENDYILATLRSLNPNEEKYPDKFKEVLYRC